MRSTRGRRLRLESLEPRYAMTAANADWAYVQRRGSFDGNVLWNDEGQNLTAALVSAPSHGTLTLSSNGSYHYEPDDSWSGWDYWTYTLGGGVNGNVSMYTTNNAPTGLNDSFTVGHRAVLNGNVLTNDTDPDGDPLTATLSTPTYNGTISLNSNGSLTYTPNNTFVGYDYFTYTISDGYTSSGPIWGYISVTNTPPVWEAYAEGQTSEILIEGSLTLEFGGDVGQLQATDLDGDVLTYAGSSSYFSISSSGVVSITDGIGLAAYFENNDSISVPVTVSDGFSQVASAFVLAKAGGWLDQSEMYVKDSAGNEYTPDDDVELIQVLENIQLGGRTVTTMIIKGHGSEEGIQVGPNEYMTVADDSVYIGSTDVTDLLNDVTDTGTSISLRGCHSFKLAKGISGNLDGAKVYGALKYVLGIPGTYWGIGTYGH
jgi:hypothetical protein